MPSTAEEELSFIMTCLKHSDVKAKPNFDAVGDELGIKAKTCYYRHWNLLKKWGMTGSKAPDAGKAVAGTASASVPATPTAAGSKRGRGARKKAPVHDDDDFEDGGVGKGRKKRKTAKAVVVESDSEDVEQDDQKSVDLNEVGLEFDDENAIDDDDDTKEM